MDAKNAFNNINKKVVLHNIRTFPFLLNYVLICYGVPTLVFIAGGTWQFISNCVTLNINHISA